MDAELIKNFGQIAGIGGLALGVFLLVARKILARNVFPRFTRQQSTKVILILAFMAWTLAIAGITAWTYISVHPRTQDNQKLVPGNEKANPAQPSQEPVNDEFIRLLTQAKSYALNLEKPGNADKFLLSLEEASEYLRLHSGYLRKYESVLSWVNAYNRLVQLRDSWQTGKRSDEKEWVRDVKSATQVLLNHTDDIVEELSNIPNKVNSTDARTSRR